MKGIIRWYNNLKGFGFITGEDGEDVIIRQSNVPTGTFLYSGESVLYEISTTALGSQIHDLTKM
ncbi:MAG: cold shock domain-containing protein [Methanobacteriota archaeon]